MKSWKIIALIASVMVVGAAVLTASAYAMTNGLVFSGMHRNAPSTYGNYGGMMGGYGYNPQITAPNAYSTGSGCGDHVGPALPTGGTALSAISINTAVTDAQNYLTTLNNPDLTVKHVEEYSNNFYVQVTEKSTGNGALELIVDKYTGSIYPEMGPNMMWNTKYQSSVSGMMSGGMMGAGGMMSGYSNTVTPTTTLPVNLAQAKADAEQYLNANYPRTTTGDITTFYGYYTIEVLNGTTTQGMLSVNGYTGQVWYHTWHGNFIQELNLS